MPFQPGNSKKVMDENFGEFRKGPTFKKTKMKFGKDRARKQMIAAVMENSRKSGGKSYDLTK